MAPMSPKKRQRRSEYERFADAVVEGLKPTFEGIRAELDGIRVELTGIHHTLEDHGRKLDDHGRKLDPLVSGSVGIGRLHALEERVTALEQRR